MKRIMAILLTLVFALSAFALPATAVSSPTTSGLWYNLTWVLTADGTLTISGEGEMNDLFHYNNDAWLQYSNDIYSVVIKSGVTSIGNDAFNGCSSLASISIPDTVTLIRDGSFSYCDALEKITVSEGNPVFYSEGNCIINKSAKTLVVGCKSSIIPDGVTCIGEIAFENRTSLTSIDIPNSVTSIEETAFWGCTALESLTIPDSVTKIGWWAFEGCSSLKSITLPRNLDSLEFATFSDCTALENITIPDSITFIGEWVFQNCTSLKTMTIPDNVNKISSYAFAGCSGLERIIVDDGNTVYHDDGNCLIETDSNTLILGCQTSVIPEYVTSFSNYAFYRCTSLQSIVIPRNVTEISGDAFWECDSLKLVYVKSPDIASGCTDFNTGNGLFYALSHVETIILSNGIRPTDYIIENYPYTGRAVIDGRSVTWYKKTEECAVHFYEDEHDADCNICGEVRELAPHGDANGDGTVNNLDASQILQHDAGVVTLEGASLTAADTNGDGNVNNVDASRILQFDAGVISEL